MNAWRELGVPVEAATAEQAMKLGRLAGWNVRKVPMFATLPAVRGVSRQVEVTDRVAVVRDNPVADNQVDYLSIVSKRFPMVQNEAYAEVLDELADESGSVFNYAGELDGGRCAFLTMRLPGQLHGDVEVDIAAINDHGGYKPFLLLATPVHLPTGAVLATFEIARVRRSPRALDRAQAVAQRALESAFTQLDTFQRSTDRLAGTPVSEPQFEQLLERHFGPGLDAPQATQTRRTGQLEEMSGMFPGGTAWDAFTVMADWYDHRSPVRGDTSRAYKAIFDTGFKDDALRVMEGVAS